MEMMKGSRLLTGAAQPTTPFTPNLEFDVIRREREKRTTIIKN